MARSFGSVSTITIQRVHELERHFSAEFTNPIGTCDVPTTACPPATNGIVERVHNQLKTPLTSIGSRDHQTSYISRAPADPLRVHVLLEMHISGTSFIELHSACQEIWSLCHEILFLPLPTTSML